VAGVLASYYVGLPRAISDLPNFTALTPYFTRIEPRIAVDNTVFSWPGLTTTLFAAQVGAPLPPPTP
jgi:hypothetical protein